MFCSQCGAQIEDTAKFCSACGAQTQSESAYENVHKPQYSQQPQFFNQVPTNALGMRWYKFLIYFLLFADAILNLITGIMRITGNVYNGGAELVWAYYEGLQAVDIMYSLFAFVFAGLCIYTRFRLSGSHSNAPKCVSSIYVITIIANILYLTALANILPQYVFESINFLSFIVNIIVSVIMLLANKTYFKKRSHLFVN